MVVYMELSVQSDACSCLQPCRKRMACCQAVELREAAEREWGDALAAVASGLRGGRVLLWDEIARRVGALLASPAAWEGEHFLQVPGRRLDLL